MTKLKGDLPQFKISESDNDRDSNPTVIVTTSEGESAFEALQRQRGEKTEMAKAALKFNFKAKNGIAYLVQAGLCSKEPKKPEEDKFEDPAEYVTAKEKYDHDY